MKLRREARGERREVCARITRAFASYRPLPLALRLNSAFSLIEVMVAMAIFFMAVFAILGLMSTLLQNARIFQGKRPPEARMVFAYQTSITNRVIEGSINVDFSEMAEFGDEFRDYTAEVEAYPNEIYTNGLWDVVYVVKNRRTGRVESTFATHQFDPNTKSKQLSGGLGR